MMRWFVLQTFAGLEGMVIDQLRGIMDWDAVWCPGVAEGRRLAARFPSYVFVRLDLGSGGWEAVNSVRGAVHLLPNRVERPTALPMGFVEELRELYRNGAPEEEFEEALASYSFGDWLRIESGAWQGHLGRFIRKVKGQAEVGVALLGREIPLMVPVHQVSIAVLEGSEAPRITRTRAARSPQFRRDRGKRPRPEAAPVVKLHPFSDMQVAAVG